MLQVCCSGVLQVCWMSLFRVAFQLVSVDLHFLEEKENIALHLGLVLWCHAMQKVLGSHYHHNEPIHQVTDFVCNVQANRFPVIDLHLAPME